MRFTAAPSPVVCLSTVFSYGVSDSPRSGWLRPSPSLGLRRPSLRRRGEELESGVSPAVGLAQSWTKSCCRSIAAASLRLALSRVTAEYIATAGCTATNASAVSPPYSRMHSYSRIYRYSTMLLHRIRTSTASHHVPGAGLLARFEAKKRQGGKNTGPTQN